MDETRSAENRPIIINSSVNRRVSAILDGPYQDEFYGGMGRPDEGESVKALGSPIERQLAPFGGVKNFEKLIGVKNFERLKRMYPNGIPYWELPVGGP